MPASNCSAIMNLAIMYGLLKRFRIIALSYYRTKDQTQSICNERLAQPDDGHFCAALPWTQTSHNSLGRANDEMSKCANCKRSDESSVTTGKEKWNNRNECSDGG